MLPSLLQPIRTTIWTALLLFLLFAAKPGFAQTEPQLEMLIELRPPMIELQGHTLVGEMGSRAQTILRSANIQYQFTTASIEQQLAEIAANKHPACSIGRIYSAQRAQQGIFSQAFYATTSYIAIVRNNVTWAGEVGSLSEWITHPELRWGTKVGYLYEGYVARQLAATRTQRIAFAEENQDVANKLIAGDFDFVLMTEGEARLLLSRDKRASSALRLVQLVDLSGGGDPRFFFCTKNTPAAIIQHLNAAIAAHQNDRSK